MTGRGPAGPYTGPAVSPLRSAIADRIQRLRAGRTMPADLEWVYAKVPTTGLYAGMLVCDCRCKCHAGSCGKPMRLDEMDCTGSCRSSHILGSDCYLDGGGE